MFKYSVLIYLKLYKKRGSIRAGFRSVLSALQLVSVSRIETRYRDNKVE